MSKFDVSKWITNKFLANAIRKNGYSLIVYNNLSDFITNVNNHQEDLVFPYYFGVASKIRESFVQTICESKNIKYVGADAYSQTIANDKALSKEICRYAGISTPGFRLLFDEKFPPDITSLSLPLIVKPQFEGDSIGISKKNVFFSYSDVMPFATSLLNDLRQPLLIEEYISGREFCVCLTGYKRKIKRLAAIEDMTKTPGVTSYHAKKYSLHLFNRFRNVIDLLDEQSMEKIVSLFHSLDKLEYIRLDFIYSNDTLYNIELTPGPDLSPYSFMYGAFKKDLSYTEFIGELISNCFERYTNMDSLY